MSDIKNRSVTKGFLAGAIGGVIPTVAMNVFQKLSIEDTRSLEDAIGAGKTYTK